MAGETLKRVRGYRKVSPSGATRPVDRRGLSPPARRWLNRTLGAVLALLVAAGVFYLAAEPVQQFLQRPVARVAVEGDFRHVEQERVMQVMQTAIDSDFLQLDLARIKRELEAEPWIEQATLARRWPDTLAVRIDEQRPIARWSDVGFLNRRGEVIAAEQVGDLAGLPKLQNDTGDSVAIMRRYLELSQLLRSRGLSITELYGDSKHAWRVGLSDGVTLVLGRGEMHEKIERFFTVYDRQLAEHFHRVDTVDLRYRNGAAVSWREPLAEQSEDAS